MSTAHAPRTAVSGMSTADARLLDRYRRTRAPRLRDELVHRYLPLARFSANRYARGSEPFDDLLQVACIGLLKAIDRFDPEHMPFSSENINGSYQPRSI